MGALPRLGVGHEPANRFDCFSDGTPAVGRPLPADLSGSPKKEKQERSVSKKPRVKIDPQMMSTIHLKFTSSTSKLSGEIRDLAKLFSHADKDQSLTIEEAEFRRMVRATLKITASDIPDSMISTLFYAIDSDGSGAIDFGEFEHFLEHGYDPADAEARRKELRATKRKPVTRKGLSANPAAGEVRLRESGLAFLANSHRECRIENSRFIMAAREKLVFEIAKQTVAGLESSLGLSYEMTTVANILRLALSTENLSPAQIETCPNKIDIRKSRELLKAARAYKLKDVANLLDIEMPLAATWNTRNNDNRTNTNTISSSKR